MSMTILFDEDDYNMRKTISDFVDPETGVHYLIYEAFVRNRNEIYGSSRSNLNTTSAMGGITPRLNTDGSIMVDPRFTSQLNPQLNPDDSRFCGYE